MKWTKKVKHGVKEVRVKEGKEASRRPCKTRDIDFVLLSPTPAKCMCLTSFPSFTPTYTLTLQARVRVSARVRGGEGRKKSIGTSRQAGQSEASGNQRKVNESFFHLSEF